MSVSTRTPKTASKSNQKRVREKLKELELSLKNMSQPLPKKQAQGILDQVVLILKTLS